MDSIAIKVENLTKIYPLYNKHIDRLKEALHPLRKKYHHDFYALKDVSFEIKKGETVGIIGKNGAGKSTLLKILTGVLTPTSGNVQINGRISSLLELGTGFNLDLTGIENIYFNGTINGFTKKEMDSKLDDIIAFADIGEFIKQPVKTYSSGMFVRLAFAVATCIEPDILIIDEALSVVDAFFQQKCMRRMNKFRDNGGTMLFVSHDMGAVVALCKDVVWLTKGSVNFIGSAKTGSELYLKNYYESQQGESAISEPVENVNKTISNNPTDTEQNTCLGSVDIPFSKEIQFFDFNADADSFGKGGAKIIKVLLTDAKRNPIPLMNGGELVILHIKCKAFHEILSPIIGIQLKDLLGQMLVGDVTSFEYAKSPLHLFPGDEFQAEFHFNMPILQNGDYSISPAIAEGTQDNHIQHHWIHDAIIFKVHPKRICFGMFGLAMKSIILKKS